MITARLPAPPHCRYPCALCGDAPARHLPKKTRKNEARCDRCYLFRRACSLAKWSAEDAAQRFDEANGTEDDYRRLVMKMIVPLREHLRAAQHALEAAELAREPVTAEAWAQFAVRQFARAGRLHGELKVFLDQAPVRLDLGPRRKGLVLVRGGGE